MLIRFSYRTKMPIYVRRYSVANTIKKNDIALICLVLGRFCADS